MTTTNLGTTCERCGATSFGQRLCWGCENRLNPGAVKQAPPKPAAATASSTRAVRVPASVPSTAATTKDVPGPTPSQLTFVRFCAQLSLCVGAFVFLLLGIAFFLVPFQGILFLVAASILWSAWVLSLFASSIGANVSGLADELQGRKERQEMKSTN